MKTNHALSQNAAILAQLLERLDGSATAVNADQYRLLAQRLAQALEGANSADAELDTVLDASPAAAQVYENLHYQHSGLCRSGLDASLAAELSAREAIARAMRPTSQDAKRG